MFNSDADFPKPEFDTSHIKIFEGYYEDLFDNSFINRAIRLGAKMYLAKLGLKGSKVDFIQNEINEYLLDILGFYLNIPLRNKIVNRACIQIMEAWDTAQESVAGGTIDEPFLITVVGHSLGSVVALLAVKKLIKEYGLDNLCLVTTGSPLGSKWLYRPGRLCLGGNLNISDLGRTTVVYNYHNPRDPISGTISDKYMENKKPLDDVHDIMIDPIAGMNRLAQHTSLDHYFREGLHVDAPHFSPIVSERGIIILFHGIGDNEPGKSWSAAYDPYKNILGREGTIHRLMSDEINGTL